MPYSREVARKINKHWPRPPDAQRVYDALAAYARGLAPGDVDRVALAVIKLSGGSLDNFFEMLDLAKCDWRDTLMAAEYPEESGATRDAPHLEQIRTRDRAQYEAWLAE